MIHNLTSYPYGTSCDLLSILSINWIITKQWRYMYPYYSLHQMPISLFKFFSGAQPRTVGNYNYAKNIIIVSCLLCARHSYSSWLYCTCTDPTWYREIYNMILRDLQHDTERFTTWYLDIYNMILRDLQHDTERFTTTLCIMYNLMQVYMKNCDYSINKP